MLVRSKLVVNRYRDHAWAVLAVCLGLPPSLGWCAACQADEYAGLRENTEIAQAREAEPAGPMVVVSDANTPARLESAEIAASQPLSPRPLMCCRPSQQAAPGRQANSTLHPTLTALAEAVRPRRAENLNAARISAPTASTWRTRQRLSGNSPWGGLPRPSGPKDGLGRPPHGRETRVTWSIRTASQARGQNSFIEPNSRAGEFSQPEPLPEPLPNDSLQAPAPIATPAEQHDDAKAEPLTISNPWTAPKDAEARRITEEPRIVETPAPHAVEQHAWRSRDPQAVRLARYHRPEAQATARISRAPAAEKPPAQERFIEETSSGENPLRSSDTESANRTGVWSSSSANPLR